jgi:hypothetical protein
MVADVLQLSGSPRNQLVIHQNRSSPGRFALTPHFVELPVEADGGIQPLIADINGDGKQEILLADKLGRTVYYENQSTPGNISLAWKGVLFRIATRIVADFDADGRLDLLSIAGVSKDSIVIAKNISLDGNLAISVVDIKASDLNGDNRPDLVIQSNYLHLDKAILFRNTSMPGQISWDYSTPSLNKCTLTPIYFGDVNADGRTDLLYLDCTVTYPVYSFGKLSVQLNQSAPGGPIGFQKMQSNYDPSGMGEVTDLNGDGLPDFAFNDIFDAFSVVQLTNQSGNTPGFRLSGRYGTDSTMVNRTTLLAGVDLDNDKRTDILLAAEAHATLRVFRNNGNDASQSGQCPSGSYQLSAPTGKVKYQWTLSVNDSAFTALTNNDDFDGSTTYLLTVKSNALTGPAYRYRCMADGIPQRIYTIQPETVFTGTIDDKWSNPLNWQCQLLPNEHTAVVAEKNMLIDVPAKVKSIRALSGVNIRLATGITLEIAKPAGDK